jgi:hypothetical protein
MFGLSAGPALLILRQKVVLYFDQVAQAVPSATLAEGLTAVFRSDQTPAFGQLVSGLFGQSSGDQKAGILNQLLSSVIGSGCWLGRRLGSGTQVLQIAGYVLQFVGIEGEDRHPGGSGKAEGRALAPRGSPAGVGGP